MNDAVPGGAIVMPAGGSTAASVPDAKAQAAQRRRATARRFKSALWALLGAVVLGVVVPTLLTAMHTYDAEPMNVSASQVSGAFGRFVLKFLMLMVFAGLGCAPGAVLLALLLFYFLQKHPESKLEHERALIERGAKRGALAAFANLPGFLALVFLWQEDFAILRVLLLFLVTGTTCGAWIGWQAYRASHMDRSLFPRFTMGTLLALVMSWGVLLVLFGP